MDHALVPRDKQRLLVIAECPRCHSMKVLEREGFHILGRWECRDCWKVFFSPEWAHHAYPRGNRPPKHAIWCDIRLRRMQRTRDQ